MSDYGRGEGVNLVSGKYLLELLQPSGHGFTLGTIRDKNLHIQGRQPVESGTTLMNMSLSNMTMI